MSKLDKFINNPKLFFKDAFKNRQGEIANKLGFINKKLKDTGIPVQLDIQIIEQSFVTAAVTLLHANKISYKAIGLLRVDRQYIKQRDIANRSTSEAIAFPVKRFFNLMSYIKADEPSKINQQTIVSPCSILSPEAKAIYLQLKLKAASAGSNKCG